MKGGIFSTSVGRKLVMSITGLFLILFLLMHLSMNLTLMLNNVDMLGQHWGEGDMFNVGSHFMISTPLIRIMEPILAAGFILHIIYATIITLRNQKNRPVGYAVSAGNRLSSWASKNMFILGGFVVCFLVMHLMQFFFDMRFGTPESITIGGVEMDNSFEIVKSYFMSPIYCGIYMLGGILLGLHLSHGFWSAFQTIGLNNLKWISRLKVISTIYAILVGGGFTIIPLYFLIMY